MIHHGALSYEVCLCVHLQGVTSTPSRFDPPATTTTTTDSATLREHYNHSKWNILWCCAFYHLKLYVSRFFSSSLFWFLLNLFCSLIFPEPTLIYVRSMWFIVCLARLWPDQYQWKTFFSQCHHNVETKLLGKASCTDL